MAAVSLTECQRMVTALLLAGSQNADGSAVWGVTIADDRRVANEIQHAIVSADSDVLLSILDTDGHPLRSGYGAFSSSITTYGDEIPAHVGKIGTVEIQKVSGGAFSPGKPASLEQIQRWRDNLSSVYGSTSHTTANSLLSGFYCIIDNKIYWTGFASRVWVATFTPNYSTPTCQAPDIYTPAVVRGAVANLLKDGDLLDGGYYLRAFERDLQLIRSGALVIPAIEQYQIAERAA